MIVTYEKMLLQLRKPEMTARDQFMLEMLILKMLENNDLVIFIVRDFTHFQVSYINRPEKKAC